MPDKKDWERRTTERRPADIDTLPSPSTAVDSLAATLLSDSQNQQRAVAPPTETAFDATSRYSVRRVLGAGGMGEVRLCADAWIGRDVAMKVVKPASGGSGSDTRGRFLREACVQGQLEHPSVVPVYDLGRTPAGETFFTMKRIGGHTLEQIVDGLRDGAPEMVATYTRRKLLSAMSQVCLTVAYAHSRGVVHRDLKPANVMLGDFGEVYVLDWGVAKVAAGADAHAAPSPVTMAGEGELVTQAGAIVGTPGYMAPEQVRGEPVTPATDIYALGVMLFEVLALDRAHLGDTIEVLIASSLRPVPAPSERAATAAILPELDAICLRATALDPSARYASARAMHDALEAFLDGERDAERRGELVRGHLDAARAALSRAAAGGPEAERHRADGIRELGRAVALDPSDEGALRTISEIVLAPPESLPPEARAELKAVELRDRAKAAHRTAAMYASWLALVPILLWMGVQSRAALVGLIVLVVTAAAYMTWGGTSPDHVRPRYTRVAFVLNFLLVAWSSTIFGPFVFTPGVATSSAAGFVISMRANRITRRAIAVLSVAAVFVPTILQWVGVLPSSYSFERGVIVIHPGIASFPPMMTQFAWVAVTLAQLVLPALLIGRATKSLIDAEERNFAQAWRLRQLLPASPRQPTT